MTKESLQMRISELDQLMNQQVSNHQMLTGAKQELQAWLHKVEETEAQKEKNSD